MFPGERSPPRGPFHGASWESHGGYMTGGHERQETVSFGYLVIFFFFFNELCWFSNLREIASTWKCLRSWLCDVKNCCLVNCCIFSVFVSSLWLYSNPDIYVILYIYMLVLLGVVALCANYFSLESMVRGWAAQKPNGKINVQTPSFPSSAILLLVRPWGLNGELFIFYFQVYYTYMSLALMIIPCVW
jgi:hypothetical protein